MGVGYLGLFDRTDHTADTEWDSRQGERITTLQIHHTAYPNDAGSRALMDPGGRTVSANGLLLQDGTLLEVVPGQFRAFTSATGFDRRCLTVETVNQDGSPTWHISEVQRLRLAKLNREMAAAGLPIAVGRRGEGGIIGHYEVPGTYATACPGPDMQLDHIAALAAAGAIAGPTIHGGSHMFILYHVNGAAQAKYLASDLNPAMVPAGEFADSGLPEVRFDGSNAALDAWRANVHAPIIKRNLDAIKGSVATIPQAPAVIGPADVAAIAAQVAALVGVAPSAAEVADAVVAEIAS